MPTPLLSVLMAVYNDAKWLQYSIPSILSQTFQDFEFIIVNDGSKDNTAEILAEWAARDSRIVVHNLPKNSGLSHALNTGLTLARADLVARHDADDVALPERLDRQYAFMKTHPEIAILGTNAIAVDGEGRELGLMECPPSAEGIRRALRWTTPFIHPSVMYRREAVLALGGYEESFHRCEDYDLWFRFLAQYKGANLPEVLMKYRIYPEGYKKKKFRFRVIEARIRWRGFRTIKALWWEYLFAAKPLFVGILPKEALRYFHIARWRRTHVPTSTR
jgi:glycosyltransferase EpsE